MGRNGRVSSSDSGAEPARVAIVRAALDWFGWRLTGEPPAAARCVIVFAPHTSNWDFPLLLLVRIALGHHVRYLAKHTLLQGPFAWFFRATGAIPVERSQNQDLVRYLSEVFASSPALWLALSPEGTRKKTDHWKSGFYYIAIEARVPVLLVFVDAARRECGVGPLIELSGDPERDLEPIRAFYAEKRGIVPENESDIRWKP